MTALTSAELRQLPRVGFLLNYPLGKGVAFVHALPTKFALWAHVLVLGPVAFAVIWRKPRTPPSLEPSLADDLAGEVSRMLARMPAGIFGDRPDDVCNRSTQEIYAIRAVHRTFVAYVEGRDRERERMESLTP